MTPSLLDTNSYLVKLKARGYGVELPDGLSDDTIDPAHAAPAAITTGAVQR